MRTLSILIFVIAAAACGPRGGGAPGPGPGPGPEPGAECVRGGCSGELCVEAGDDAVSPCIWRDEFACYREAACERQPDGACGWTPTPELEACLADPPPPEE